MTSKQKSRMGINPLAGVSLLDPTTNLSEEKIELNIIHDSDKTPIEGLAAEPVTSTKIIEHKVIPSDFNQNNIVSEQKRGEMPQDNPFGYEITPTWPLVSFDEPYLVPQPEGGGRGGADTITIRIPMEFSITIDAHCKKLGANLSEWTRSAMLRQLSVEQKELARRR